MLQTDGRENPTHAGRGRHIPWKPGLLGPKHGFLRIPGMSAIPSPLTALASRCSHPLLYQPNEQNVVKCAIHAAGYTHATPATEHAPVSSPVFPQASGTDIGTLVPCAALHELGDALRAVFPALARKPWCGTRLCW